MKYELSSLIDEEKAQSILDAFCNAVGVAAAIIDMEGRVLVGSRWQKICTDFHRKNKDTFKKCIESDTILANKLHQGKRYSIYQCPNGLTDAASPIVIEGEHVANAFVGQFLLKTPDPDRFRRQAATYGFDENAYLEALEAVPVVKEHSLPAILDFLSGFAEMVAIMGLNHVKQREAQETLREREEKYRQIFENSSFTERHHAAIRSSASTREFTMDLRS
jgi:ligand-binding sensor protein